MHASEFAHTTDDHYGHLGSAYCPYCDQRTNGRVPNLKLSTDTPMFHCSACCKRWPLSALDAFTAQHLATYADSALFEDDRAQFVAWVHALDASDLDYYTRSDGPGWPGARNQFYRETERG